MMPATALLAAGLLLVAGCGGTLEGKYRRGQITTSTTSSTTVPTAGNAAGQRAQGEPGGPGPGGTIMGSATWRQDVLPFGGRHR